MNKIVVLGGTFNPLTLAHLEIINEASKLILNSEKIMLPTNISYLHSWKKYADEQILPDSLRLKILNFMAVKNNYKIETCELEKTTSKTYDSLNFIKNKYNASKVYFICGAEKLSEFYKWYKYESLLNEFDFIVFNRNGVDAKEEFEKLSYLKEFKNHFTFLSPKINIDDFSSTKVRKALKNKNDDLLSKYCGKEISEILLKWREENEI